LVVTVADTDEAPPQQGTNDESCALKTSASAGSASLNALTIYGICIARIITRISRQQARGRPKKNDAVHVLFAKSQTHLPTFFPLLFVGE
jgi:hypothetical protein